jgi:hypothetical protein
MLPSCFPGWLLEAPDARELPPALHFLGSK